MPLSNALSANVRWQKPWIVEMEIRSKISSALRRELSAAARRFCVRSIKASNNASSVGSPASARNASASLRRMRSRNSAVAASVNVTTRMSLAGIFSSTSRRRKIPASANVLPVPALASSRVTPKSSGVLTKSKVMANPPRFDVPAVVRQSFSPSRQTLRPAVPRRYGNTD